MVKAPEGKSSHFEEVGGFDYWTFVYFIVKIMFLGRKR